MRTEKTTMSHVIFRHRSGCIRSPFGTVPG
jgi:hypothetical protein